MHDSEKLLQKMKKKGWSKDDLEYARTVFSEHQRHHHIFHPAWDYVLHWFLFFIILVANLSVFFYMIPIIIIGSGFVSYLFLAILGLSMGAVFDIVIADLTHLEKHHHVFISFIIPIMTVILFMLSMYLIQRDVIVEMLFVSPLALSLVYTISIMIPYYLRRLSHN